MPTDAEIVAAMREREAPWGYRFRHGGRRPAFVPALVEHVRDRLGDSPGLEDRVDRCVRSHGGVREALDMDLDDLPKRLLARLRGRRVPPKELYVMPPEFFGQGAVET